MEIIGIKCSGAILISLIRLSKQYAAYFFKARKSVRALEAATERLRERLSDVDTRLDSATRKGMQPRNEVEGWLKRAEHVCVETEKIQAKYDKRTKCMGSLSPCICVNYMIAKSAAANCQAAEKIYSEGMFEEYGVMVPQASTEVPITDVSLTGTDRYRNLAVKFIRDEAVSKVGLWGPGGVGKTHLLHQINNLFHKNPAFDVVIRVTASKGCSVAKVQDAIVGEQMLVKKDDTESQAVIIYEFLKSKNFLILLDDLWEHVDLDKVGIPNKVSSIGNYKQKLLLTTRSESVCGQMGVKNGQRIKVDCLDETDAWHLFKENVGTEIIENHPLVLKLAKEVANELAGLPLALIVVGRAMSTKRHPREWQNCIDFLQQSRLNEIEGPVCYEESVFARLKLSYEYLSDTNLKDCFTSCALWPDDYLLDRNKLSEYWMGLGLVEEEDIQRCYNAGYARIRELVDKCLLEETDDDRLVKMHDVIRDMALWIYLPEELGSLFKLEYLLLRSNPVREMPETILSKLSRLQVADFCSFQLEQPSTFEPPFGALKCMRNLKALGITINMIKYFNMICKTDLPVRSLCVIILTKYLDEWKGFAFSDSFFGNDLIQKNLSELYIFTHEEQIVFESNVPHRSSNLEKLYICGHHFTDIFWKGVESQDLFQNLRRLDLISCFSLENISWVQRFPYLEDLIVYGCSALEQIIGSALNDVKQPNAGEKGRKPLSQPCLKRFVLLSLKRLTTICHSSFDFPSLESFHIFGCPQLMTLPFTSVPCNLKYIHCEQEWLDNLQWDDANVKNSFQPFFKVISMVDKYAAKKFIDGLHAEWMYYRRESEDDEE
ncbi:disease resistance protein SUMM2-like [Oryza glaberrima]|uniref:disease resistance protein SUMM2-like n=1 Tax=Oryza glaberrima TaxID=4538 RepID=UPI00224C50F0|nr:disease resistance protein SUMM2-like [Oryza glaberrima]